MDWRFFCDTVPIDIYSREYVDDEKYFNYSTCDRGRWTCEEDRCSSSCEIVGLNHVATFDGNRYSFAPDSCSYTLVEVKTRDPPKISNLLVIFVSTSTCNYIYGISEYKILYTIDTQLSQRIFFFCFFSRIQTL